MQFSFRVACCIAATVACCALLSAEEISGTMFDRTGAVISDARVILMNSDYVKLSETKSGPRGEFSFAGLQPALYFVQAKKPRFQLAQHHVDLKAGTPAHIYVVASVARGGNEVGITADRLGAAPSGSPGVHGVRSGGRVEGFQRVSGNFPAFPEAAKKRGARGTVALMATIQADGTLADLITLDSPDPDLERACLEAFKEWRFTPMKLDGVPVQSELIQVFRFDYR